jgi:hypothetical protein
VNLLSAQVANNHSLARHDSTPSLFVGLRKTKSNYLLSTAREKAKEHKHNNDDDDDPKDSADRKEHSERCKHFRLLVGVSVSSLLVGLRNGQATAKETLAPGD